MKEEILALLIAAFAGVRKDGLTQLARTLALQATTKDEAKALVDKLTKTQVDEFVKEFRADVDKEVTDGNKTYEASLKKKFDFVEKEDPNKGGGSGKKGDDDKDDIAAAVKAALATELEPLKKELASYKEGDVTKARLQTLTDKLSGCKDETFKAKALKDFGRMKFETDEEFNEYLTDTETDIATANQSAADSVLGDSGKPFFTQKNDKGVSSGVSQFLDSQKADTNPLTGKEV